jgi:hypothetical protein
MTPESGPGERPGTRHAPVAALRRLRWAALAGCVALLLAGGVYAQREFREYPPLEGDDSTSQLPPDYQVPGEFILGRLMYPSSRGRFGGGNYKQGYSGWTVDYPLGDRNFLRHLRRLTTINVRTVEQPTDLDDGDDVFNWPFLIASFPGTWNLSDTQAAKLRDYLLRGGFLFCDSFFGTTEWNGFSDTLRRVFPDRPIVELSPDHPILHTLYDITDLKQVPNGRTLRWRGVGYRSDGAVPHWRAVLDDENRVMVLIAFNNDVGDSWQYADVPEYPQSATYLGIRLGADIALYAMTH